MRVGRNQVVLHAAIAIALIGSSTPAWAQQDAAAGAFQGRVVGPGGDPVQGAQVVVSNETTGTQRGAVAGEDGRYVVSPLPAGTYTLVVRAIGHRLLEREDLRLDAGEEREVDITLATAPVELEGLTVTTATRSATPIDQIPGAVSVITRPELDEQATLTPRMGAVLTQLVPGLAAGTQSMSTYGQSFRGRKVAVLIDGVPQSTTRDASRDFVTIDPAAVERIEVLRGATSIYGDGATGGVINIITRSGAGGPARFTTDVRMESSLSAFGEGVGGRIVQTATGGQGPLSYMFSGSLASTGGFYDADGDRIPSDPHGQGGIADMNRWDLLGKLGYDLGDQRFAVMVNHFSGIQDTEFTTDPAVNEFEPGTRKSRALEGLVLDRNQVSENTVANLDYRNSAFIGGQLHGQLYYRDYLTRFAPYDGRPFESLGSSIIQSYVTSEKLGGRLELETGLDGWGSPSVVWGVDYDDETTSQPVDIMDPAVYEESGGLVFEKISERGWVPEVNSRSIGLFAQAGWSPLPRWSLRGGVRHERAWVQVDDFTTISGNDVEGGELDYAPVLFNVGAVFQATDAVNLFAAYSQGFSLADVGRLLRGVPAGFVVGSQELEAQKVDHYEVGTRGSWGAVHASVSGFYNESELGSTFNEELEIVRAPERVYGFETTLDITPAEAWSLGGTLTWTEGENDVDRDGEYQALDGYRIQPLKLTAYLENQTLDGWSNRLQVLYSGSRDRAFEDGIGYGGAPVQEYTLVDWLSSFDVGPGTLNVGIENLFNNQYFPVVSQLDGELMNSSHAAGRGRTLSVGYSWTYGAR